MSHDGSHSLIIKGLISFTLKKCIKTISIIEEVSYE